ncbi:hypothetical protein GF420_00595, partial [candidate division GN15 bacterium]|nr:hypothetical protein [candidate division GN15 bacterium]
MSEPNAIPRDIAALLQPDDYGLAFAPRYNRNRMIDGDPARREEVHDADYFRGSAERFCEFHGESRYTVHVIDNGRNPQTQEGDANSNAARRQQILDILDDYDGPMLRVVGIFCHGYRDGIQLGFSIRNANERGATDQLLDLLAQKCRPDLIVPIYACSTGSSGRNEEGGEGGFADYIRD